MMSGTPPRPAWWGHDPPDDWPERRRDGVATAWHVVFAITMAFLAYAVVATVVFSLTGDSGELSFTKAELWFEQGLSLLLLGVIPFLWVAYTRVGGLRGAVVSLRMQAPGRGLLEGAIMAVALLGGLLLLGALLTAFEAPEEQSGLAEALVETIDWPLVFAISFVAGVAEEVLFRGILQRWFGVWGQGVLFGISHAGYDTVLNVAVPLAIGVAFGFVYRWRRNLWTVIVAHFLYDLALLSIAMWAGQFE